MMPGISFSWDLVAVFVAAFVVAYALFKVAQLYVRRKQLPPGPFPWPLIGNLLSFNHPDTMPHEVMNKLSEEHGPVYTLFMGHMPCVVVHDPLIAQQVLRKSAFAGRPSFDTTGIMYKPGSIDVILSDFSSEWTVVKKVVHTAIHKYSLSAKYSSNIVQAVDRVLDHVGEECDTDHATSLLMNTILAEAAFGQKYEFDDPEFIGWCYYIDLAIIGSNVLNVVAFAPILRFVLWRRWNKFLTGWFGMLDYIGKIYKRTLQNHAEEEVDGSFCHAFINAKMEAEEAESKILPALNDQNLSNAIMNLFVAGTETSKNTIKWMLILLCKHPDVQQRLRDEVNQMIGGDDPNPSHRSDCHLLQAFIHETIRFKANLQTALPHKTLSDEMIGDHKIPKGTTLLISLGTSVNNENVWGDPHVFRPERFLNEEGAFILKNSDHFIPFGSGRRSCPGDKLALSNLFLIAARLLQKKQAIMIPGGVSQQHMRGDTEVTVTYNAIPFKLKLVD